MADETAAPQMINVIDPSGKMGAIPADQMGQASTYGYKVATPEQVTDHFNAQDYGQDNAQQAKAALEAIGRGATFGALTWAEKKLGVDPKDIEMREKYNP